MSVFNAYRYILDENGNVVPCPDLMEWATWFEDHHPCYVARDVLTNGILVSTIFLALDHSFGADGQPLLFETMVFLNDNATTALDDAFRYPTREAAVARHIELVAEYSKRQPGD